MNLNLPFKEGDVTNIYISVSLLTKVNKQITEAYVDEKEFGKQEDANATARDVPLALGLAQQLFLGPMEDGSLAGRLQRRS